jgi:hypothetical protein
MILGAQMDVGHRVSFESDFLASGVKLLALPDFAGTFHRQLRPDERSRVVGKLLIWTIDFRVARDSDGMIRSIFPLRT